MKSFIVFCGMFIAVIMLGCKETEKEIIPDRSIKPALINSSLVVDSEIMFSKRKFRLVAWQQMFIDKAKRIIVSGDTLFCNNNPVELRFYKNDSLFVNKIVTKEIFEEILIKRLDSLFWGYKGIDSLTEEGVYITFIASESDITQPHIIQFIFNLTGDKETYHVFENENGIYKEKYDYKIDNVSIITDSSYENLIFKLYTHHDYNYRCYDSIVVTDTNQNIIQTIPMIKEYGCFIELKLGIEIEFADFNFDGYKDINLLSSCGGTGNCWYYFWLYEKKNGLFVYNEQLSELCLPGADAEKKEITAMQNSGNQNYLYEFFKWYGNNLILVREVKYSTNDVEPYQTRTERRRVNGKMKLISKKIVDETTEDDP